MIVNLQNSGWEVIYQRAHGLLAVKLASHWRENERGAYWLELLAAITQHDNNQKEFCGDNYLTMIGAPADFMVASGSPLAQAQKVVDDASYQGRYVALMTSMHTSTIYVGERDDEAFAAFLDEQAAHQKKWRRALKLSKADAERDYAIMSWCDRMSLILCQNELPTDSRRLEVTLTPTGEHSYVWQREDETLGLEPWPFSEGAQVKVSVEATYLTETRFESDEALHAQRSKKRRPEVKSWTFVK